MKIESLITFFPGNTLTRCLNLTPNGKDMHKRVRNVPSIVDLDVRFKMMDLFDDYAQVICIGRPRSRPWSSPRLHRLGQASQRRDGGAGPEIPEAFSRFYRLPADERSERASG